MEETESSDAEHESDSDVKILRRSERSTKGKPPERLTYKVKENTEMQINPDPKSIDEIEQLPKKQKEKWLKAMQDEINSLNKNETWQLVDQPKGKKIIDSKWIFKTKYDENGEEIKCKARLVAKGYDQRFGTDYDETFAPVVKHTTIRTFFAAASHKKMKIHHVDIKTAFLYGKLEEELYMAQPEGFQEKGKEDKVCKLNKSIYGLKQSAKAWNEELQGNLVKQGFQQSKADPCLFTKGNGKDSIFIVIYVDDILLSSQSEERIQEVIRNLKKSYEITDLGEAKFYLGIEILKDENGNYFLSQQKKIEELIQKFQMEDAKPTYTPMETNYYQLEGEEDKLQSNELFRQAVGALLYISTVTRPDIAAATHIISRRCHNPRQRDWNAVKRIIRYLKTTKDLKLKISSDQEPILKVYADADWGQDRQDRKSTSGNIFLLGTTAISWKSAKQNCVALSSTEAEYVSLAQSTQELLWILTLLEDLQIKQNLPITILEDNQATIKLTQSGKFSARNKHIDIKYHHMKNLRKDGIIDLDYCATQEMSADIMTKPLPKPRFEAHRTTLNLVN